MLFKHPYVPSKAMKLAAAEAHGCLCVPFRFLHSQGFGIKESGKIALNGGWLFSCLTGSAYVDGWQFFLRGKSG